MGVNGVFSFLIFRPGAFVKPIGEHSLKAVRFDHTSLFEWGVEVEKRYGVILSN